MGWNANCEWGKSGGYLCLGPGYVWVHLCCPPFPSLGSPQGRARHGVEGQVESLWKGVCLSSPRWVLTKNLTLCTSSSPQNSMPAPLASSFLAGGGGGAFLGGSGGVSGTSSFSPFSSLQGRMHKEVKRAQCVPAEPPTPCLARGPHSAWGSFPGQHKGPRPQGMGGCGTWRRISSTLESSRYQVGHPGEGGVAQNGQLTEPGQGYKRRQQSRVGGVRSPGAPAG